MNHPIKRAKERYGVDLRVPDLVEIAHKCRNLATCQAKVGKCRVHLVDWRGTVMRAVFDPERSIVKTFLARDHRINVPGVRR